MVSKERFIQQRQLSALPPPGSDRILGSVKSIVSRRIYEELFRASAGLDISQLRDRIPEFADQMHFDRRLRALDRAFVIQRTRAGGRTLYRLVGVRAKPLEEGKVSKKARAAVLYRDGARCQMCGANPQLSPEVRLEVDHKVPLRWGGSNGDPNLWTLCKECNEGKQAFFSSADEHAVKIRSAIKEPEVHRRIGRLLQAFGVGEEVPAYMISLVASAIEFQGDWSRRLRDLRDIGWDYEVHKRKEGGRVVSYYVLTKDGGWPATGTVRQAISGRAS